ncbi:TetR/AcrR family transcriptional regulator [Marinicella sp. S1101]|uniref:TetR/AcrR family transcriptional regulator n=1 Tax=Marinicella marina TaxID=2996016 RepID=UPI002260F127|nr:TetR/AcrR family transcriptional regulator [Marinicella marina]MCX7552473.1 TetR/AcrR family transcriptional regulator [Marinicella marina]MDJ1139349.1 TetR/AcrR family transcriptional regulator [Marinicella marina]
MMSTKKKTKDLILDAAEQLFAVRGFYGVSIRQITSKAEVDPALASYHFGKKQDIFEAVMLRRAEILNRERIQMLDDCIRRAKPNPAPLHEIIDAFTHALLNRSNKGGQGWKSYFAIIAQINNHPELGGVIMSQYFDPLAKKFIAAIHENIPNAKAEDLFWCYHFLSGALTLTFSGTERISKLSDGLCASSDLDAVHERLVPFITAGFKAFENN